MVLPKRKGYVVRRAEAELEKKENEEKKEACWLDLLNRLKNVSLEGDAATLRKTMEEAQAILGKSQKGTAPTAGAMDSLRPLPPLFAAVSPLSLPPAAVAAEDASGAKSLLGAAASWPRGMPPPAVSASAFAAASPSPMLITPAPDLMAQILGPDLSRARLQSFPSIPQGAADGSRFVFNINYSKPQDVPMHDVSLQSLAAQTQSYLSSLMPPPPSVRLESALPPVQSPCDASAAAVTAAAPSVAPMSCSLNVAYGMDSFLRDEPLPLSPPSEPAAAAPASRNRSTSRSRRHSRPHRSRSPSGKDQDSWDEKNADEEYVDSEDEDRPKPRAHKSGKIKAEKSSSLNLKLAMPKQKRQNSESLLMAAEGPQVPLSDTPPEQLTNQERTAILRQWFMGHICHPYPDDQEKVMLAKQTGQTVKQVSNWFTNVRKRSWSKLKKEGRIPTNMHVDGISMSDVFA